MYDGTQYTLGHGSVVIAAITSCTNTSNPSVMLGAGLLAKKAVEAGLTVRNFDFLCSLENIFSVNFTRLNHTLKPACHLVQE